MVLTIYNIARDSPFSSDTHSHPRKWEDYGSAQEVARDGEGKGVRGGILWVGLISPHPVPLWNTSYGSPLINESSLKARSIIPAAERRLSRGIKPPLVPGAISCRDQLVFAGAFVSRRNYSYVPMPIFAPKTHIRFICVTWWKYS